MTVFNLECELTRKYNVSDFEKWDFMQWGDKKPGQVVMLLKPNEVNTHWNAAEQQKSGFVFTVSETRDKNL